MKTRILLVDDFRPWRLFTSLLLKTAALDFQIVGEASDGVEAIEKAATLLPDVVLLDVGMPRLNGLDAARRIRQLNPDSKIIFLTEQDDDELRNEALAAGAVAYVVKSRAASELQLRLESVMGRSEASFLHPAVASFPSP